MDETTSDLVQRYFDGGLSDAQRRQLEQLIEADRAVADDFAHAARLHAELGAAMSPAATASADRLRQILADTAPSLPARGVARRSRWRAATAVLAASLAIVFVVGVWQWWFSQTGSPSSAATHRVVSGRVFADGAAADQFADGTAIRVAETGVAVIDLADGSQAEFDAASRAVLHGRATSARPAVELLTGGGVFRVAPEAEPFRVTTPLGNVTALGTEFSVEILADAAGDAIARANLNDMTKSPLPISGESGMKFNRDAAWLAVVVLSGMVQVDIGGTSVVLRGGSGQVFAEDGEKKETRVAGKVKALNTNTRAITLEGRKREGQPAEPDKSFDLSSDVQVLIDGQEKTIFDVAAGASAVLTLNADGKLVATIAIGRARGNEERREPQIRRFEGELTKLDAPTLTVTRRRDSGPQSQSATLVETTKIVLETAEDDIRTGEGGKEIRTPRQAAATASDLKLGQRVEIHASDAGEAVKVIIRRPPPPRSTKEGEGEKSPAKPANEQRGGEGERERKELPTAPRREQREDEAEREAKAPAQQDRALVREGLALPDAKLVRSDKSGQWSAPATWEGGAVPAAGNQVLVRTGHQIVYDVDSGEVLRSLHVSGTLSFAHDRNTRLEVGLVRVEPGDKVSENGFDCDHPADERLSADDIADASQPGFSAICLCCQSKAALLVGTPERPIDAAHTAVIRLHYVAGMDQRSCPAIVCCGGRMDFHGAPLSRTWVKLGASVPEPKKRAAGDDASTITLAEAVLGWRAGDRVIVTSSAMNNANDHAAGSYRARAADRDYVQYQPQTEERIIRSIDGKQLTLDRALDFGHRGQADYAVEVANLSRNVVVESAAPDGVRGHTMYHSGSAGSISYAEFRHLGKEGILGRYAIHYHKVGDSMRGASVVGASIWDSHNRWLTIHGAQYLVVRDCVGYQSVGHGFFLEDGTEVYNVLDRNLAVQAFRGMPLAEQILPFDKNDGAGFWWANSHNSFTRNVAVECDQYGFRYDAAPRAGVAVKRAKFGSPGERFDLSLAVRKPDGTSAPTDIRTLPFIRFDHNEVHSMHNYGFNMGEGVDGVGPAAENPFVIRDFQAWLVRLAYRPNAPHVLLERAALTSNTYGIYQPEYIGHDYRDVVWTGLDGGTSRLRRMPGDAKVGDGGGKAHAPDVEVAKLNPIDKLPPNTVITGTSRRGKAIVVSGVTSDNGAIQTVLVNGQAATVERSGRWEVTLRDVAAGLIKLSAHGIDAGGNTELTPHTMSIVAAE